MRSDYHRVNYRSMPAQSRFGYVFGFFHDESCYTTDELQFRIKILNLRANSGLDADLLQTDNSWFASDEAAFINVNEHSWVLNAEFRPRHALSRDDFHINLIDSNRLQWPELGTMTRVIGDYLLLRNANLEAQHLNQPMNYVLLDVTQILRRLSMSENADYVKQQLQLLQNYLRAVEIHTSPVKGSDRLFLTDCRQSMENHQASIENHIQSRQLKTQIHQIQQELNRIGELRHTILHFALSEQEVNPHPYWEHFASQPQNMASQVEFPTLAAKNCAQRNVDELSERAENPAKSSQVIELELSPKTLSDCRDFKFVSNLPEDVQQAYSDSLVDLQEILRFEGIVDQLLQLFDKAGEVFTIVQFREQMQALLLNIEQFIQRSHQNIMHVIEMNAILYQQFIQDKQNLSWWEKLMTQRQHKIDSFINNQDNLARFDVTQSNLLLASKKLFKQIKQVITHLEQQAAESKQLQLMSSTRNLVEQLIDSMHAWMKRQHQLKGLPLPKKPEFRKLAAPDEKRECEKKNNSEVIRTSRGDYRMVNKEQTSTANRLTPSFQFWSSTYSAPEAQMLCSHESGCPILPEHSSEQSPASNSFNNVSAHLLIGLIILLPVAFLALKGLYAPSPQKLIHKGEKSGFKALQVKTADLISVLQNQVNESNDPYAIEVLDALLEDYSALMNERKQGRFPNAKLQELYENLINFRQELQEEHIFEMKA
nr:hypothetical protein [Legionella jordanis]